MLMEMRPIWGLRDPISAATHAAACLWFLYLTAILWRLCRGERLKQWSIAVFGISSVILYAASALSHSVPFSSEHFQLFRLIDHSAIYLLIAGTYTPAVAVLIARPWRTPLLISVWILAALGIASKWLLLDAPYGLTISLYVGMGWLGLVRLPEFWRAVGLRGAIWGIGGGLLYTVGALLDWLRWPVPVPGFFGHHEIFHICDILGSFFYLMLMIQCVIPYPGHPEPVEPEPAVDYPEPAFAFIEKAALEESV
jgi:channel protein (hemolysin III family)